MKQSNHSSHDADPPADAEQEATDAAGVDAMTCPHCMRSVPADSHFCEHCGGPITSIASMDPLGSVYAQGFGFGKAVDRPTKPIIFWGMWFLLGPQIVVLLPAVFLIAGSLFDPHSSAPLFARLLLLLLVGGLAGLYAMILFVMTRNHLAHRALLNHQRLRCPRCDYDLRGSKESASCPECGAPITQRESDWDELEERDASSSPRTDAEDSFN